MEDIQMIMRVDTPADWCAGTIVVATPRVIYSTPLREEEMRHISFETAPKKFLPTSRSLVFFDILYM